LLLLLPFVIQLRTAGSIVWHTGQQRDAPGCSEKDSADAIVGSAAAAKRLQSRRGWVQWHPC
jgi:hypothetical protein